MKKVRMISLVGLIIAIIAVMVILPACKTAEVAAPETVIVKETVVETVIVEKTVEVEKENPYTFENLRKMADAGKYEGTPAADMTCFFNNILQGLDFATLVENSILENWKLAGGKDENMTIVYNDVDATKQAQIIDQAFALKPDGWLEFCAFEATNKMTGTRARAEGLFMVAIDIPVQGFPFMGADNFNAGRMLGEALADYIDNVWGGWDKVDLVLCPWNELNGPVVNQRCLEPLNVFKERYGETANYNTGLGQMEGSKVVMLDSGGNADIVIPNTTNALAANPDAKKIVCIEINAQGGSSYSAAAETLGRWNADDWLVGCHGSEAPIGHEVMRAGKTDFDVAYFPEKYGNYLIPAIIANYYGNPVPADIFVDHVVISLDNIDEYYPKG